MQLFGTRWWLCCTQNGQQAQRRMVTRRKDVKTALSSRRLLMITSGVIFPPKLCICLSADSESYGRLLMKFVGGEGCATSIGWLDFDSDPDHDVDTEFLKGIFTVAGIGIIEQILLISQKVDEFLWHLAVVCLVTRNKPILMAIWITFRPRNF